MNFWNPKLYWIAYHHHLHLICWICVQYFLSTHRCQKNQIFLMQLGAATQQMPSVVDYRARKLDDVGYLSDCIFKYHKISSLVKLLPLSSLLFLWSDKSRSFDTSIKDSTCFKQACFSEIRGISNRITIFLWLFWGQTQKVKRKQNLVRFLLVFMR